MTRKSASTWRGERTQASGAIHAARSPAWRRAAMPLAIRINAHTLKATAMTPGNSAGPTFCPGMVEKLCTCTRITTPSRRKSAPQTASLIFIARSRDAGPSFPQKGEPSVVCRKTLDPRMRGDDAATPLDPRMRGDDAETPLDPRFRGDDAAVSDRCEASPLALGQLRHLAIPTAFIVAPRSASDLAMNLAKSSGPA